MTDPLPSLKSAELAGSGDMKVDSMTTASTKLSIAGAGNIGVASVETASLNTSIAGSGNVIMAGSAESAKISIAGSGDINAKDLNADSAKISVVGSGDVELDRSMQRSWAPVIFACMGTPNARPKPWALGILDAGPDNGIFLTEHMGPNIWVFCPKTGQNISLNWLL